MGGQPPNEINKIMSINWAQLYSQGRVKAIGVPWSDEDREALASGISVDDVRNGILKKEDKERIEKTLTPLEKMKRDELIEAAKELDISFDETVVTRADLIMLIKQKDVK
jgi:hypothetical protein